MNLAYSSRRNKYLDYMVFYPLLFFAVGLIILTAASHLKIINLVFYRIVGCVLLLAGIIFGYITAKLGENDAVKNFIIALVKLFVWVGGGFFLILPGIVCLLSHKILFNLTITGLILNAGAGFILIVLYFFSMTFSEFRQAIFLFRNSRKAIKKSKTRTV